MISKDNDSGKPISKQLAPLKKYFRSQYSSVVPVSQVALSIADEDDGQRFNEVTKQLLIWIKNRAGASLPDAAWDRVSFEIEDTGAQRVAAVRLENPDCWAARVDDADENVARRFWLTEVAVGVNPKGGILFGSRLTCVTRGEDVPFQRSIPGFIQQIAELGNVYLDGRPLIFDPWIISDRNGVEELVELLRNPSRHANVLLVSLPEDSEMVSDAGIDITILHRKTMGAAHVAVITGRATFMLTDIVGREFSVFQRGVRTYRPGFDPDNDEPFTHPLGLWRRIQQWEAEGPPAYSDFLINQTLAATVARKDREEELPAFSTLRQLAAKERIENARSADASTEELLSLADKESATLRKELEEFTEYYDGELNATVSERDQIGVEYDHLRNANRNLNARVQSLLEQLTQSGAASTPIPESTEAFSDWCKNNLSGSVEVLSRANRGVKNSVYDDQSLIYRALLLLRDHYVPHRRHGGAEGKEAYLQALLELGLEETQSFSASGAGEHGDTYYVRYRGHSCTLDRHLKKGNSREPRYCFRMYFFWDSQTEQAVVGWLPSLLETRAS